MIEIRFGLEICNLDDLDLCESLFLWEDVCGVSERD